LAAEEPVARELDLERQQRAAAGAVDERRLAVVGVQPLQDPAVDPQRRLAVRGPEQVDAPALPVVRHRPAHAEPERGPERPVALLRPRRPVRELLRLRPGDAVDGSGHEQLVDAAHVRVDERAQALGRLQ
jgi:hypothetical protein